MRFLFPLFCLVAFGLAQEDFDRLTFHQAPKPLSADAKTEDWPRFLGAQDNATSAETHLLDVLPEGGPTLCWEVARGESYTCPTIVGDRVLNYHNIDDVEIIECLQLETGKRFWKYEYKNVYRDMIGYANGPRASPTIDEGKVYTLAATSRMHCLQLETGEVVWERDLASEYGIPQYFFGHGPTPLIADGKLYMNLGGDKGVCVAAFDKLTGEPVWELQHAWGASYASPMMSEFHGKPTLIVFAGGRSNPPHGGLLLIDPKTGELRAEFPWRATLVNSVNATTPLILPNNQILITETYSEGGVVLEVAEDFSLSEVWRGAEFKCHWMQPLLVDGHLYAFTGRNEPDAGLDCWNVKTGQRTWREEIMWAKDVGDGRTLRWSLFRGSILQADGKFFALGEMGTLARLDLTPEKGGIAERVDLFDARETWTLPSLSKGLLFVAQNQPELDHAGFGRRRRGTDAPSPKPERVLKGRRILCYDFRRAE